MSLSTQLFHYKCILHSPPHLFYYLRCCVFLERVKRCACVTCKRHSGQRSVTLYVWVGVTVEKSKNSEKEKKEKKQFFNHFSVSLLNFKRMSRVICSSRFSYLLLFWKFHLSTFSFHFLNYFVITSRAFVRIRPFWQMSQFAECHSLPG